MSAHLGSDISRVLAIETSCDDTSIAIVDQNGFVESVVSADQDLAHAPFGGVVPEIASRNHTLQILPLLEQAFKKANRDWKDIQGIVVTNRPGLVGSLLVGLSTAKTLAQVQHLPMLAVNHLEGHILAPFLSDTQFSPPKDFAPPFLALAVSGGHTSIYQVHDWGKYEILGTTRDDAAGEAFDKFAKLLGMDFPGGVRVDRLAEQGDPQAFALPRGLANEENLEMSFSGLKSSAQRLIQSLAPAELDARKADLCASFREAVVDALMIKLQRAVDQTKIKKVAITGGVSANLRLRAVSEKWAAKNKIQLVIPPLRYCTDNAAMIGFAGIRRMRAGEVTSLNAGPNPNSLVSDFVQGKNG